MPFSQLYKEYFPFWKVLSDGDKKYLCDNSSVVHFEKEQALHLMCMWKQKYRVTVI